MTNFWKPFALLLIISLTSHAAKADDYISDDDLQNDDLIPEDAGSSLDSEEFPVDKVEEPIPPEEDEEEIIPPEEGSGDEPVLSMRSFSLGAGKEPTDVYKCIRQENAGLVINCQGGGLSALPEDLDASTAVLDMSFNNLTQLSASTFPDKLDNLKVLVLSNNLIQTIDKNAFSGLPRLEKIDLSSNALTSLDPETFAGLVALSELDLGTNNLELPAATPFLNVPALRKLQVAGCGLQHLPESTFDGMTSLEELDLGDNPIADGTGIVAGVFAALSNLSALTLPREASPILLTEVCRSHGLLPSVCLGSCAQQALPCHTAPAPVEVATEEPTTQKTAGGMIARAEFDAAFVVAATVIPSVDTTEEEIPLEIAEEDDARLPGRFPASGSKKKSSTKIKAVFSPEDSGIASSTSDVSESGANKTVIGLIIGGMLVAVALVVVVKNWSKIRGRRDEGAGLRPGAQSHQEMADLEVARSPEEVPLQNKSPPV